MTTTSACSLTSDPPTTIEDVVLSLSDPDAPPSVLAQTQRARAGRILGPGPLDWTAAQARRGTDLVVELNREDRLLPVAEIARGNEWALQELLLELMGRPTEGFSLAVHEPGVIPDAVRRSVPIARVVGSLRHMQTCWTQALLDHALSAGGDIALARLMTQVAATCFDRWIQSALASYFAERDAFLSSASAHRRQMIEALIHGQDVDSELVEERLGLQTGHHHIAIAVTRRGDMAVGEQQPLRSVAAAAAEAISAETWVQHETSEGTITVWGSAPDPLDTSALLGMAQSDDQVVIGVGTTSSGPRGFRRTHLEALDALRLASQRTHGWIVRYEDVALVVNVSRDLERAQWFVHDQLGRLAEPSPSMARLREALGAYLSSNLRIVPAAQELHLHRNSFINRLQRIEEALGHPIGFRVAELQAALILIDEYGDVMLDSAST